MEFRLTVARAKEIDHDRDDMLRTNIIMVGVCIDQLNSLLIVYVQKVSTNYVHGTDTLMHFASCTHDISSVQ